ncbi:MAG: hypothetical protein R3B70_12980 [Polyangiaceae bacterium]
MRRLIPLPVLFSSLSLFLGVAGCNGSIDVGTGGTGGGTGGTETGGGGTGGSTGGGGIGGFGPGGTGGSTNTGGAPPTCSVPTPIVLGCLQSDGIDLSVPPASKITLTSTVADIRTPEPNEPCGGDYWYRLGYADGPDLMIDFAGLDAAAFTVGLKVPGFSKEKIQKGETLTVTYEVDTAGFGGRIALLDVQRNGNTVVAVGENASPGGFNLSEGTVECYNEDSLCGREQREMLASVPDAGGIAIPTGTTKNVGGLLVTNDHLFHNYDVSGGCNFGMSVEYLMSAAEQ